MSTIHNVVVCSSEFVDLIEIENILIYRLEFSVYQLIKTKQQQIWNKMHEF